MDAKGTVLLLEANPDPCLAVHPIVATQILSPSMIHTDAATNHVSLSPDARHFELVYDADTFGNAVGA